MTDFTDCVHRLVASGADEETAKEVLVEVFAAGVAAAPYREIVRATSKVIQECGADEIAGGAKVTAPDIAVGEMLVTDGKLMRNEVTALKKFGSK